MSDRYKWGDDEVLSAVKFTGSRLVLDFKKVGIPHPIDNAISELERIFPFFRERFLRINGVPVDEKKFRRRIGGGDAKANRRASRSSCVSYDSFVAIALVSRKIWTEQEVEFWCGNMKEIPMTNSLYAVPYFQDESYTVWLGTKVGITKNKDMRIPSLYMNARDKYGIFIQKTEFYEVPVGDNRDVAEQAEELAHAYCMAKMGKPSYGLEYFNQLPYKDAVRFVTLAAIGYIKEDEL